MQGERGKEGRKRRKLSWFVCCVQLVSLSVTSCLIQELEEREEEGEREERNHILREREKKLEIWPSVLNPALHLMEFQDLMKAGKGHLAAF